MNAVVGDVSVFAQFETHALLSSKLRKLQQFNSLFTFRIQSVEVYVNFITYSTS